MRLFLEKIILTLLLTTILYLILQNMAKILIYGFCSCLNYVKRGGGQIIWLCLNFYMSQYTLRGGGVRERAWAVSSLCLYLDQLTVTFKNKLHRSDQCIEMNNFCFVNMSKLCTAVLQHCSVMKHLERKTYSLYNYDN